MEVATSKQHQHKAASVELAISWTIRSLTFDQGANNGARLYRDQTA
jgi:hypothetical protein